MPPTRRFHLTKLIHFVMLNNINYTFRTNPLRLREQVINLILAREPISNESLIITKNYSESSL